MSQAMLLAWLLLRNEVSLKERTAVGSPVLATALGLTRLHGTTIEATTGVDDKTMRLIFAATDTQHHATAACESLTPGRFTANAC
jgi:hypothetical protein